MTGVLLMVIICIIYVFASATIRSRIFKAFWITHQLYYLFYFLILLHGASRIVQNPHFPSYFLFPAVLFIVDKMISLSRRTRQLSLIKTELLQSGMCAILFIYEL